MPELQSAIATNWKAYYCVEQLPGVTPTNPQFQFLTNVKRFEVDPAQKYKEVKAGGSLSPYTTQLMCINPKCSLLMEITNLNPLSDLVSSSQPLTIIFRNEIDKVNILMRGAYIDNAIVSGKRTGDLPAVEVKVSVTAMSIESTTTDPAGSAFAISPKDFKTIPVENVQIRNVGVVVNDTDILDNWKSFELNVSKKIKRRINPIDGSTRALGVVSTSIGFKISRTLLLTDAASQQSDLILGTEAAIQLGIFSTPQSWSADLTGARPKGKFSLVGQSETVNIYTDVSYVYTANNIVYAVGSEIILLPPNIAGDVTLVEIFTEGFPRFIGPIIDTAPPLQVLFIEKWTPAIVKPVIGDPSPTNLQVLFTETWSRAITSPILEIPVAMQSLFTETWSRAITSPIIDNAPPTQALFTETWTPAIVIPPIGEPVPLNIQVSFTETWTRAIVAPVIGDPVPINMQTLFTEEWAEPTPDPDAQPFLLALFAETWLPTTIEPENALPFMFTLLVEAWAAPTLPPEGATPFLSSLIVEEWANATLPPEEAAPFVFAEFDETWVTATIQPENAQPFLAQMFSEEWETASTPPEEATPFLSSIMTESWGPSPIDPQIGHPPKIAGNALPTMTTSFIEHWVEAAVTTPPPNISQKFIEQWEYVAPAMTQLIDEVWGYTLPPPTWVYDDFEN